MSHDGSSCKSYIKHLTEKERLDHLAFSSFPEDYLPYASREGHKPAPYLVWGEGGGERRRRPGKKRRGCCSTAALVSAIALIVAAILAAVAISVYLGVVTNLFRSPVLSLSGKFRVSEGDEFSEEFLNTTSYQFLTKAESYQSMVENAFLSSSLEPAFIAARIYGFRPGMLVFFRVYLDRRKLQQDDTETLKMVGDLMKSESPAFGALKIDKKSVDVDENEDWITFPGLEQRSTKSTPATPRPPPKLATAGHRPITRKPGRPISPRTDPVPIREATETDAAKDNIHREEDKLKFGYGQWNPVPIEDSVSPSFGDQRTPPGRGSVRFLEDGSGRFPPSPFRPRPDSPNPPPAQRLTPGRPSDNPNLPSAQRPSDIPVSVTSRPPTKPLQVGVGSVSVLEDPLSHVDPIPMRGLRVLATEAPPKSEVSHLPQGEVASSVMSSVSLVVRPPLNKSMSNGAARLGTGSVRPVVVNLGDERTSRKEEASLRFLDDSMSGDVEDGALEDLDTSGQSSGTTPEETVPLTKPLEDNLEKSDLDRESVGLLTYPKASIVEYVESVTTTAAPVDKTTLRDLDTNHDGTTLPQSDFPDASTTLLFEISKNSSEQFEEILEEETSTAEGNLNTDIKTNMSLLDIHSINSDIGMKYLNYSVGNTLQPTKTNVLFGMHGNFQSLGKSEEVSSSQHESLRDTIKETTQSVVITKLTSDLESISTFSSGDLGEDELMGVTKNEQLSSVDLESGTTHLESILNSEKLDTFTAKEVTGYSSTDYTARPTAVPTSNPFNIHTQEGHGFHKPIRKPSVVYSGYEANTEDMEGLQEDPRINHTGLLENEIKLLKTEDASKNKNTSESLTTDDEIREKVQEDSSAEKILDSDSSKTETTVKVDPESEERNTHHDDSSSLDYKTTTPMPLLYSENSVSSSEVSSEETTLSAAKDETNESTTTMQSTFSVETFVATEETTTAFEKLSEVVTSGNESITTKASVVLSGKIVPQLSDLGFNPNDINSNEDLVGPNDDLLDEHEYPTVSEEIPGDGFVEIIRHITTVPPTLPPHAISLGKNPIFISQGVCSVDEMRCGSGECVDATNRCNMRRDCVDNSDEKNCSCSDLLQVMGQSQKICDGVEDCRDHSDEQNCPWCEEGQVVCPQTKFCINRSQLCDGQNDCPFGSDERYCVKLAESVSDAEGLHYRSKGFLMVRKSGDWGKLCLDHLSDSVQLRNKLDDLGEAVCTTLTYSIVSESNRIRDPDTSEKSYFAISNEVPSHTKRSSAIFQPSTCESKQVLKVECRGLDCGLRPLATSSRRRIVGGHSSGSGSWPWSVALYKEGDFQCGAVLVSDVWLISAAHCFYSTQDAYWTARLGLLRRGSELPSPSEQVRRISRIVLHPEYVDKGFINDISLLRMDRPVLFSDYLRPVCLPTVKEDPGLWHGKECSVVGWGKLYEIGHTFPDSLQEVRLPVISTEECRKRILFLTMYHITDNMFCAGYERGGRDACLGDSGGPLMCQRDDGRWLLLGVTSNGDGCGRPGRPGVYTKVVKYLSWIQKMLESDSILRSGGRFVDSCDGIRCNLGRCIPPFKMCDNRWDCSEGADEDHCEL